MAAAYVHSILTVPKGRIVVEDESWKLLRQPIPSYDKCVEIAEHGIKCCRTKPSFHLCKQVKQAILVRRPFLTEESIIDSFVLYGEFIELHLSNHCGDSAVTDIIIVDDPMDEPTVSVDKCTALAADLTRVISKAKVWKYPSSVLAQLMCQVRSRIAFLTEETEFRHMKTHPTGTVEFDLTNLSVETDLIDVGRIVVCDTDY